ncbi:Regulatory protein RecX [plant metagenome]|uniref:Regulatory protein RecX n=1 Tax=plant metagenome TaxID=1297885 RepID=A0A484RQQ5_9ZZZZ
MQGIADEQSEHSGSGENPSARGSARRGPSLKARAVDFLSRREHGRQELGRKLARHSDDPEEIESVLDSLAKEGWLSDTRYVQSIVQRRGERQGTARIVQELRRNGVDAQLVDTLRAELQSTEYERARQVWAKRYADKPATTPTEYARQARFLAARGFGAGIISKILKGSGLDDDAL